LTRDPRQLCFQFGPPPMAGPAKPPASPEIVLANLHHMLHVTQIMRLDPARPSRKHYELERLEVWLRAEIKLRKQAIQYRRTLDAS
jgi:hypothetical protein